jgi:hypothetical protein
MGSPELKHRVSKVKIPSTIQDAFPSLNSAAHPNLIKSVSDVEGLPFVGPKTLQKVIRHGVFITLC